MITIYLNNDLYQIESLLTSLKEEFKNTEFCPSPYLCTYGQSEIESTKEVVCHVKKIISFLKKDFSMELKKVRHI